MNIDRIIIGVLVALLILIVWMRSVECEDGLAGFWTGGRSFLKQAGLKTLYLYISPESRGIFRKTRDLYVFAEASDGKILDNFMTELVYWRSPIRTLVSLSTLFGYKYNISARTKEQTVLSPERMTLSYCPYSQTLSIIDEDDEIAGFMYKDPGATDMAKNMGVKSSDLV